MRKLACSLLIFSLSSFTNILSSALASRQVANSKFRRRYDDILDDDDSDFDDYEMNEDLASSQQFYQVTEVVDDDEFMENGY